MLIAANTGALPGYTAPGSIVVNPGATLAVTAGTNAGEFSLTSGGGVDQVLAATSTFAGGANLGIQVNEPGERHLRHVDCQYGQRPAGLREARHGHSLPDRQ